MQKRVVVEVGICRKVTSQSLDTEGGIEEVLEVRDRVAWRKRPNSPQQEMMSEGEVLKTTCILN